MHDAGASVAEIARRFDLKPSVVKRRIGYHGGKAWRTVGEVQAEARAQAEAYRNGETIAAIAKRYGQAHGTVRSRLYAQGVAMRPRGRPRPVKAE